MNSIHPSGLGDSLQIVPEPPAPVEGTHGGFGEELGHALKSVEQLQQAGDQQAAALAEGSGNLHETSIALAKAEVGMHFMMNIRNKVVDAYQDVMKMSI